MFQHKTRAAYLSASANGATQIGLHIMVYDVLAGDLLRAGEACRKGDIAARCSASNRALLLLGHLESWTSCLDDQRLIQSLQAFYRGLRVDIVRLQVKGTPVDFSRLSETVQGVRTTWQDKELSDTRNEVSARPEIEASRVATSEPQVSRTSFVCCA